jgi:predicted outer membrane protein
MKTPSNLQVRAPRGGAWLIFGALALASVAEAASAWRTPVMRSWGRHFAAMPLATETLRPSEQGFLESALALSRQETRLAELAAGQATNSDVRALALEIPGEQRALRESVEGLLRRKGMAVPADLPVPEAHQRLVEMSGSTFDREIVMALAKLHEELVTLFEQAASDGKDPEVRDIGGRHLPALREHRNRLIELRKIYE